MQRQTELFQKSERLVHSEAPIRFEEIASRQKVHEWVNEWANTGWNVGVDDYSCFQENGFEQCQDSIVRQTKNLLEAESCGELRYVLHALSTCLIRGVVQILQDLHVLKIALSKESFCRRLQLGSHFAVERKQTDYNYSFLDKGSGNWFVFINEFVCVDLSVATRAVKSTLAVSECEVDITRVSDVRAIRQG